MDQNFMFDILLITLHQFLPSLTAIMPTRCPPAPTPLAPTTISSHQEE